MDEIGPELEGLFAVGAASSGDITFTFRLK